MLRSSRTLVSPHVAIRTDFSLSGWDATVEMARVYSLLWPACWVDPDRSGRSPSTTIQNIWVVYIQELSFVPREVREQLVAACNTTDVDASWCLWSREAGARLARAYRTAGGPALTGPSSCVGEASLEDTHVSERLYQLAGTIGTSRTIPGTLGSGPSSWMLPRTMSRTRPKVCWPPL